MEAEDEERRKENQGFEQKQFVQVFCILSIIKNCFRLRF